MESGEESKRKMLVCFNVENRFMCGLTRQNIVFYYVRNSAVQLNGCQRWKFNL